MALLGSHNQQENRLNLACPSAQRKLNDNRRLYRSTLLLDQDRAVRGVNLALLTTMRRADRHATVSCAAHCGDPANFLPSLFGEQLTSGSVTQTE